jgi:hypothetical protein
MPRAAIEEGAEPATLADLADLLRALGDMHYTEGSAREEHP